MSIPGRSLTSGTWRLNVSSSHLLGDVINHNISQLLRLILLDNWLMVDLTLPTSLVEISDYAFHGCGSLRAVIVPT